MKSVAFIVIDDNGNDECRSIEDDVTVRQLKEIVREAFGYASPGAELTLFVAKHKHSGQWLNMAEVEAIQRGEVPVAVRAIVEDASAEMSDPDACIGDSAFGFPDIDEVRDVMEDTHVLVVLPESAKRARRLRRYCQNSPNRVTQDSWLDVMLPGKQESLASAWRWLKASLSSGADKKAE